LQERSEAWKLQKKRITRFDQQKELTELHKDARFCWISAVIQQHVLLNVDLAFQAFFRRCKAGERPGYPRFRKKERYSSFTFSLPNVKEKSINVPKVGYVRMRGGRPIEGTAKTCTIKRQGTRWIASVVCDVGPAPLKCVVASAVGIDLGLMKFITFSDGSFVENPRWIRKFEAKIAAANRALARKQKRSKNRLRAKEVLRRTYQRMADARRNYCHHISKDLVECYDLIAYEDLDMRGMVEGGKYSKSIMDAAWGQFIWQLSYKAESAGRWAMPVNPRGTSRKCSQCGADVRKTLYERRHICACGANLDRDHNAAMNIERLGMSLAGLSGPSERT
jgi:putative transposase